MKVAVVGGGLAGLAAALELVDAGHDVDRLRGAADARRRRADAARARGRSGAAARQRPAHRARLLHRVPALPRAGRRRRLVPADAARAAGARRGRHARRRSSRASPALLRYRPPVAARPRCGSRSSTLRCAHAQSRPGRDVRSSCSGGSGATRRGDRPLLGRLHPAGAQPPLRRGRRRAPGSSPSAPRCSARARTATSSSRRGRSAGCTATRPGACSATRVRLDAARRVARRARCRRVVVAVPPRESARLLGEEEPALEDSPIVSVHLWFDRPLLDAAARGAARLGRALGLRPRRAHRAAGPSAGST